MGLIKDIQFVKYNIYHKFKSRLKLCKIIITILTINNNSTSSLFDLIANFEIVSAKEPC